MKKFNYLVLMLLLCSFALFAQPSGKRDQYDISKDRVLYTIGYAHLDTQWNWVYPTTINEYIKNIMTENFNLFEKYPDYVFNFTGSRRYQMMKEYYPELYQKVIQYVKQGRWYVSGSSVDEGEVNISSSESLVRQVLYGNAFFRKEFGVESKDYMLPDCFGFLANMPTIWNYCGLLGFSTQKLTWHSAVGVPFNVGIWNGPDGKGIIAALNATTYTGSITPRLDLDKDWNERIDENQKEYGFSFDYRYYGVGDQGGAPRERDVKNAIGSLHHSDSKFKVVLTSSDQIYKDITPEIRSKLPVYSGDLLLTEHSAGSMTSQAYMKRVNRKNELLAQSAEQLACIADWTGRGEYSATKLNNGWNLVLGSQFHDILPGTSVPKAYEYAWNDEFIAANCFSEVLKHSLSVVSRELNTRTKGRSLVVYNSVAQDREDVVTAEMEYDKLPEGIQVYDGGGKALPTQIIDRQENKLKFIFLAKVPSIGVAVFDVRETKSNVSVRSVLSITSQSLENAYYKVKIGSNGDITSIFDKKLSKELLSKPARLEFLHEKPTDYPAWNMDWNDRKNPPIDYLDKDASFSIVEQGPVRVAIEVKRNGRNSEMDQIVSLSAGEAGKRLEVANKVDWQSKGVCLKASFPLTASNDSATYNLGVGAIKRSTNNRLKYEVPSKEWFDLTDKSEQFGVSVLEDCKYGSDKPDDKTLRLTLLYTPETGDYFRYQNTQDWGVHEFKYGLYSHSGDWRTDLTPWQGKFINQPLLAFEAPKHDGKWGRETSMLHISTPQVGLMAFKKMEQGDYYVIRVNELFGKDINGIHIKFKGDVVDAYEVNGQEKEIGKVDFQNGMLNFDMTHYTIRSFAVKFKPVVENTSKTYQAIVDLPYNQDAMSFDDNRDDCNAYGRSSLPAELVPGEVISEGIHFKMGNTADGQNNVVSCNGQEINLPSGDFTKVYVLASAREDTKGDFLIGTKTFPLSIQDWTGYIGQFYNRRFALDGETVTSIDKPFLKKDNIAWFASHRHLAYPSANEAYQYVYLYKYEISLPNGAKSVVLPKNQRIKVFAITAVNNGGGDVKALQPLTDDFTNSKPADLRN
jgi:alpha-mannosidase